MNLTNSFPIELMPEHPNCPWCLQPMEKTGTGMNATLLYHSTSFTCLHHPHKVWISIRHDDNVFRLNLIHLYIGQRLRIKYDPYNINGNRILLQENSLNNLQAWQTIAHLPNNHSDWPQSLNYNDLINKIDSFLPFI